METKLMRRRQLMTSAIAFAASMAAKNLLPVAKGADTSVPIGLQLYTVIGDLEKDFEGTLRSVSEIGYREVETMGSFGRDPSYVRDVLHRYGLSTPSQHIVSKELYAIVQQNVRHVISGSETEAKLTVGMGTERIMDLVHEAIATAKILGQSNVVWPAFWAPQMHDPHAIAQFCDALNKAGDACFEAGLTFGFHNHGQELHALSGQIPYDLLISETNPKTVKLEMDVYWMTWGKKDPIQYLRRHPGRYNQIHLKDAKGDGTFAPMGEGIIQFAPILAAARRAGVQHYYVEQNSPDDPIAAVRKSFIFLRSAI
jgi:sugar phosphate isomerase/epimerase